MGDGSGLETWNPEQERDEDESPGEKAGAPRGRAGTEAQPRASCGGQSLTGGGAGPGPGTWARGTRWGRSCEGLPATWGEGGIQSCARHRGRGGRALDIGLVFILV